MLKYLSARLSKTRISTKFLLSYMMILLLAVVTVTVLVAGYMTGSYRDSLLYSAERAFEQADEFLSYRVQSVLYVSDMFRVNHELLDILKKDPQQIADNIAEQTEDMMYADQQVLFRSLDALKESSEWDSLNASGQAGVWLPPQELYSADTNKTVNVISYIQAICDNDHLDQTIAAVRISMRTDDLEEMIEKANSITSGLTWIENADGKHVTAGEQGSAAAGDPDYSSAYACCGGNGSLSLREDYVPDFQAGTSDGNGGE